MFTISSKTLLGAALVASFALCVGTAVAQDQTPQTAGDATAPERAHAHMPDPDRQLAHLTKQLGLSNDQAAKIGPILKTREQQITAIRADSSLKPADRREKMHTAMQTSSDQINAVLTDPQRKQYEASKEQMAQQHAHHSE